MPDVPNNADSEIALVAEEIRRYLETHPNAADSAEGVAKWWLTRQRFEHAVAQVQRALELLVAEGLIGKRTTGGKAVYARLGGSAPQP